MSLFKRYYPVLVAVLVAVLPLGMNTYWTEVAVNVGLYALLALSLNVILGQAGIFHMGHAAFYAVGAYVTAILNTHYQIPILLLIPVACVFSFGRFVMSPPWTTSTMGRPNLVANSQSR